MTDVVLADLPDGVDEAAWMSACAAVRAYCGWHIAPVVEETLTLDGPGGHIVFLPTKLLVDLVSLTSDGDTVTTPEWSASGKVRTESVRLSSKFRGIVAAIEHGYTECPADLLAVVGEMASDVGRGGVSSVTSGSHQVRYEVTPSSRQRSVLDQYRLVTGFA